MTTDKIQPVLSPWPHMIQKLPTENIENTINYSRTPPKRKGQEEERRKKTRNDRQNNDHANWVAHYKREKIWLETRESYTPKTRKIETRVAAEEEQKKWDKKTQRPEIETNPTFEILKITIENLNKLIPSTSLSTRNRFEKCIADLKTIIPDL